MPNRDGECQDTPKDEEDGTMTKTIMVVYEHGVLRPVEPLDGLPEAQPLTVTIELMADEESDPIDQVIGLCAGGPVDGAAQHDHYIYGSPKR